MAALSDEWGVCSNSPFTKTVLVPVRYGVEPLQRGLSVMDEKVDAMNRMQFLSVLSFWFGCWAPAGVMAYVLGAARARVPGAFVGRIRVVRLLGRRRADALLEALVTEGVEARYLPDRESLAKRIGGRSVGGSLTSLLLMTPAVIAAAAVVAAIHRRLSRSFPAAPMDMSVWFLATVLLMLPSVLPAVVDDWGVRRSDASGTVTMRAVGALETLLLSLGVTGAKSLVEVRAVALDRLCRALRDQARHEARPTGGQSTREATGLAKRLIRDIRLQNHELDFCGDDRKRQASKRVLAELISSALRYSCRSRRELDGLVAVDRELLSPGEVTEEDGTKEPLGKLLGRIGVHLCLAAAIFAGAAFLAPRGVATDALGLLAVAVLVPACVAVGRRLGFEVRPSGLLGGAGATATSTAATDLTTEGTALPVSGRHTSVPSVRPLDGA